MPSSLLFELLHVSILCKNPRYTNLSDVNDIQYFSNLNLLHFAHTNIQGKQLSLLLYICTGAEGRASRHRRASRQWHLDRSQWCECREPRVWKCRGKSPAEWQQADATGVRRRGLQVLQVSEYRYYGLDGRSIKWWPWWSSCIWRDTSPKARDTITRTTRESEFPCIVGLRELREQFRWNYNPKHFCCVF